MIDSVVHRRSALEAFACPWRYHEIVMRGVQDDSPEAQRGQCLHAAARIYTHALAAQSLRQDADLAEEALRAAIAETLPPAGQVDDIVEVWQFWAERFELDLDAFLLAEERQIRGRRSWTPDVIYAYGDVLDVRDLKSFHIGLTQEYARTLMQTRFYIAEAAKIWPGFRVYRMTYEFMRLGWSVSVDFEADQVEALDRIVHLVELASDAARKTGAFPAKPGPHCDFCRLTCPLEEELRATGRLDRPFRLTTEAEAHRAAEEYLVLERALEQRKESLAVWVATMGELDVQGALFHYRIEEEGRYPALEVFRTLGLPIPTGGLGDDVTLSKSAIRRYLTNRRFQPFRAALERLAVVTKRSVFAVRVPGRTRRPERGQAAQGDV